MPKGTIRNPGTKNARDPNLWFNYEGSRGLTAASNWEQRSLKLGAERKAKREKRNSQLEAIRKGRVKTALESYGVKGW